MPVPSNFLSTMNEIFIRCQDGQQAHLKLVKTLRKVYDEADFKEFTSQFGHLLRYPLVVSERAIAVERTLNFIAKFASSFESVAEESTHEDDTDPFLDWLFRYLLKIHDVDNRTVRFRVCQLINKLLNNMTENAQIDDDLYNVIFDNILERLSDKVPAIRVQAVFAMSRLQDPSNKDCVVINAYLFHLNNDPNTNVRKAVISCIAASSQTMPHILERCRDVQDSVRRAAYMFLSAKVHIKSLTIAQRVQLLHEGLKERSVMVKRVVERNLLKHWLKLCENDVQKLLKCLDVENSIDTANLVLNSTFKSYSSIHELGESFKLSNEEKTISEEDMTCEKVLHWRALCQYLKESADPKAEQILENLIPELLPFCEYLHRFISNMPSNSDEEISKKLQYDFVCQQLLILASVYDFSDTVGRNSMDSMIRNLLYSQDLNIALIKPLISRFCDVTSAENRINEIAEIISEIREPTTVVEKVLSDTDIRKIDVKMAKISVELLTCKDELEECIAKEDFQTAQELKTKITELQEEKSKLADEKNTPVSQEVRVEKTDAATTQKCLTIIVEISEQSKLQSLNPTLHSIMETLILPGIQDEDPLVRNLAVRSLGMCCHLSKETALQHFVLLLQISQVDQETVRVTALKAIFDILMIYGLESFNENTESCESESISDEVDIIEESEERTLSSESTLEKTFETAKNVTSILTSLLSSEFTEVCTTAAEGLGKLLFMGRIYSAKLLSRLIIMWYNPVTEDCDYLRHFLGVFLPAFSVSFRKNQECLEEAFLPTLRTLYNAPLSSPLAEVDSFNVAKFLIQLTAQQPQVKTKGQNDSNIHNNLAVKIANEILQDPNSINVRILIKILLYLDIVPDSKTTFEELVLLTDKMLNSVRDRSCEKPISKFKDKISSYLEKFADEELKATNTSCIDTVSGEVEQMRISSENEEVQSDVILSNSSIEKEKLSSEDDSSSAVSVPLFTTSSSSSSSESKKSLCVIEESEQDVC
ncbi:Condensin complex subunit 3 [Nymphon striatum]|nr:Condensin complex subunit 3 [Nymphon striatum]